MLAVFALCFFVSIALLSASSGGIDGGAAFATGDAHTEWAKYNDSETIGGMGDGGTADTAWLIGNAIQLKDLADKVNGVDSYAGVAADLSGKYIRLTADIDLSGYGATFNGGAGWTPIGNYSTSTVTFNGSFDGGGFTVSGLYINITGTNDTVYVGLFGYIGSGSAVSNLGVSGSVNVVSAGFRQYVGGIAGYVYYGSITDSYNMAAVNAIHNYNSYSSPCTGGIAGFFFTGNISRCYNTGAVTTGGSGFTHYIGGIVGELYGNFNVTDSYNIGEVSATGDSFVVAGGIAGDAYRLGSASISGCYNMGEVSATSGNAANNGAYAGGIVGGDVCDVTNNYNAGSVNATSGGGAVYVGGIAAYFSGGSMTNNYNTGSVATGGSGQAGGIVGARHIGTNVTPINSYYDINKFSGEAVGNLTLSYTAGLTTAQMTAADALTTMSGINGSGAFTKRQNDATFWYYPELVAFSGSTDPAIVQDSKVSVTTSASGASVYKIIYNYMGATGGNVFRSDVAVFGSTVRLVVPTKTYHAFLGWFDAADGGEQYTTGDGIGVSPWSATSDKTLYARWTLTEYEIIYHLDGGTNAGNNPEFYTIESTDITLAEPTRAGYDFVGWYTDAGFGTAVTDVAIAAGSAGNKSFWAKWTVKTYTVSFEKHGGEGTANDKSVTYDSEYGELPGDLTKPYYTFDGWWTETGGTGTRVTATTTVKTASNHTLYAKWTATEYDVIYHLDGGINAGDNPEFYTIESAAITLEAATRIGYRFDGWYRDAGFSSAVTGIAIPSGATGAKTFYAKWTIIEYTITYNLNDGTIDADANPTTYTVEDAAITLATPTREGYTFVGWFDTADLSGSKVTDIAAGSTGDKTFYAKWRKNVAGIIIFAVVSFVLLLFAAITIFRRTRRRAAAAVVAAAEAAAYAAIAAAVETAAAVEEEISAAVESDIVAEIVAAETAELAEAEAAEADAVEKEIESAAVAEASAEVAAVVAAATEAAEAAMAVAAAEAAAETAAIAEAAMAVAAAAEAAATEAAAIEAEAMTENIATVEIAASTDIEAAEAEATAATQSYGQNGRGAYEGAAQYEQDAAAYGQRSSRRYVQPNNIYKQKGIAAYLLRLWTRLVAVRSDPYEPHNPNDPYGQNARQSIYGEEGSASHDQSNRYGRSGQYLRQLSRGGGITRTYRRIIRIRRTGKAQQPNLNAPQSRTGGGATRRRRRTIRRRITRINKRARLSNQ
jgi:uncharacterized repeat protein (TIGR02543 family)